MGYRVDIKIDHVAKSVETDMSDVESLQTFVFLYI